LQVFGQYGYRRTSMDDIAREAGVGKGTIYRAGRSHFRRMTTRTL
jgi:AcrR family transcriptional regulator